MKLNRENNFFGYFLFLFRKGFTILFLLGFFTASAQIYVSEGTSFVVKEGTIISAGSKDAISKKQKVKVYVQSKESLKKISDSEQIEIVLEQKKHSINEQIAKNKTSHKKEVDKNLTREKPEKEKPKSHSVVSFPVPKSCLSNSESAFVAVVQVQHSIKKNGCGLALEQEKISIVEPSKLQQNYFFIAEISFRNNKTNSIRPPPVFVII